LKILIIEGDDFMQTKASDVIESFESSFQDKCEIPASLEYLWLKKAIARFCIELSEISLDDESKLFDSALNQYEIDTLAMFMKKFYQEREVSKVNKRVSIVSKDLSIDGNNGSKTAAKNELDYICSESEYMIANQKPTAYV